MLMKQKNEKLVQRFHRLDYLNNYRKESKWLKSKRKLWKNIQLTKEQEKEIHSVFGNTVDSKWHRLYQSYTKVFNKNYFPELLFRTRLEPVLCPKEVCRVLQDKSLTELLYKSIPGLRLPRTVVVNCSGIFYDGNRNIINKDVAVLFAEQWCKYKNFVIRPLSGTTLQNCRTVCNSDPNFSEERVKELFDRLKKDFILQEYIENSEELAGLNAESFNTIQIMTYILDGRLYHSPIFIRMGRSRNQSETIPMKDLFIGVNDDGKLYLEAYTEYGDTYRNHPVSQVKFENYYIPNISKIIDCAYACHRKTPHIRFITWEFIQDENKEPVLLEAVLRGHDSWLVQAVSGESLFGDNTKRMLELISINTGETC